MRTNEQMEIIRRLEGNNLTDEDKFYMRIWIENMFYLMEKSGC